MTELLSGREFQTWVYSVSHGFLLLRSPATNQAPFNVDLIFAGVEYMALPRHLHDLTIDMPTRDEIEELRQILGKDLSQNEITIVVADGNRHPVVSTQMKIETNTLDLFDYPFEFGGRERP